MSSNDHLGDRIDKEADRARARALADTIAAEIDALPVCNTPNVRAVRLGYSRMLKGDDAEFVLELARELGGQGHAWVGYELIAAHPGAFRRLGVAELEELGHGIESWSSVDSFARTLAGPAWRDGLVPDELIDGWARSPDRWRRRAALVSTVALNMRSQGGTGDTGRTLAICRLLADDGDDMVVKAMSWALRELAVHDADAVRAFLAEHDGVLAARVKREVRNKMATGLKNPRRGVSE